MKIAFVGEAWGYEEAQHQAPFMGASGQLLRTYMRKVGINAKDCLLTNVFNLRPGQTNDILQLCGTKAEGIPGMPALKTGKYVKLKYADELSRLYGELRRIKPNVIVALGTTACWALHIKGSLERVRGATTQTSFGKVFPTYHPSALFRDHSRRPIFAADFVKISNEQEFPETRRPQRTLWIEPTPADFIEFDKLIQSAERLSIDIETRGKYITCVGFAPSNNIALVVPFIRADNSPYWPSALDDELAWSYVRKWCQHPSIVGQNFLYDAHRLWRGYGITAPGLANDTMLLHHALYIELEKGLGFLGSVYTNEARWKYMRETDTLKKEDE